MTITDLETPKPLTNAELEARLLALPEEIAGAEESELILAQELEARKDALKRREAELITSGAITGSNEMQRKASLIQQTAAEAQDIASWEQVIGQARIRANKLRATFHALRSLCRLRGGAD